MPRWPPSSCTCLGLDAADGPVALGLFRGLQLLEDTVLPLLLLMLGMQLRRRAEQSPSRILGTAVVLRLVVSIPLAAVIGLALGLGELRLRVGIVQAVMPTAVSTTILALEFDA
jgi:predicted permease